MEPMTTVRARPVAPPDVDAPAREARRLSTLLEVSQALSGTLNLKASLHRVLEILARHHGAVRGIVSLLQPDGELRVEASDGLADAGARRHATGRRRHHRPVVQSGKPIVVPRVSREPMFLHRAARRPELPHQELSFVCVPIMPQPPRDRRAGDRPQVQARSQLRSQHEVPRRRRVDDRRRRSRSSG